MRMIEKDYYLKKKNGDKLYINILENDIKAPNVIYIQTPTGSVAELKECYLSLSKYGLNVFALDLSGVGKSDGDMRDFSVKSLQEDIEACIEFISENYNDVIHLFGGTGTGGILGQYYASGNTAIKSFVQYGLAIHKDVSIFPNPHLIKVSYGMLPWFKKVFPNLNLRFSPTKYNGKNADKENEWYEKQMKEKPESISMHISLMNTLCDIFLNNKSNIINKPSCPVLVFAPKHDRYYSFSYIERYYKWLDEPKEIYIIEDSHLSFIWHAEEICKAASEWFKKYSKE